VEPRAFTGLLPEARRDKTDRQSAHETIFRWFGARLLRPAEAPGLFSILVDVCRRARLSSFAGYLLSSRAFADECLRVWWSRRRRDHTDRGLLRGMTRDEIAGILAHEVAHIRSNDIWTMSWAAALHRSIEWTSLAGLALLRAATWLHGG